MSKKLWQLLKLYLVLGVEPPDEPAEDEPEEDETPPDEKPADDELPGDDLDSLIEHVEEGAGEEGKGEGKANKAIREARARAQTAEEARIRAEAERDEARRQRTAGPQGQTEEQRQYDAEEARLRDSEVPEVEKWQIRSNRTLRANTQAANQALNTASDMRDRNEFDRLAMTKPKVFKLYESKVEKALTDMRARGENAPRMALLSFLIGKDIIDGKVRSKPKERAAAASAEAGTSGVDRGRSPGARSDVSGKGKLTSKEKLEKKLTGVAL